MASMSASATRTCRSSRSTPASCRPTEKPAPSPGPAERNAMTDANPLHAVPDTAGPVDLGRIEKAVREILFAIGEDPDRDGLVRTPTRVAEMYAEICAGLSEDPAPPPLLPFLAGHARE